MSGLVVSAPDAGLPSATPVRDLALRLAAGAGRGARPAAASSAIVAAVGTAMSVWASTVLTTNLVGRPQLPLTVERARLDGGRGSVRLIGPQADVRGTWGLWWPDGYAVVDGPDAEGFRDVRIVSGDVAGGRRVRLDAHLYDERELPPELTFTPEVVVGPAGPCPAWRFQPAPQPLPSPGAHGADGAGADGTWAVFVHGRGARLSQALRVVPTLRAAGCTTLVPSYRGDEGAPAAALSGLGCHEWRDLEAAVQHAVDGGARRVVLIGYSMGGALITAFLRRSPLAPRVAGVVLDSPVLDWGAVLRHVARGRRLPSVLVPATMTVSALRARIDWRLLNAFDGDEVHRPPCLLFHGTADDLVPVGLSDALAEAWPDRVTYHRIEGALHVAAYNVAPRRYERALRAFLEGLGVATAVPGSHPRA